jgi:viologen exporter family transport system permease protein
VRRYLSLLRMFVGVGLQNEMQYRANLALELANSGISLAISLGSLAVIYSHTDSLGGWRPAELIMLTGIYYVIAGIQETFVGPGMRRLADDVRLGTLDFALTKPVSSQFYVSFRQVEPWQSVSTVIGVLLLAGGAGGLGGDVGVLRAALFLGTLVAAAAIVYSFRLMLATLSFWMVRTENLMVIFDSLYQAGKYPVGLYPGWLRAVLTFVVPVAFATTVPAEALAGRTGVDGLAVAGAVAVGLLVASSVFWRLGLRSYTGASA